MTDLKQIVKKILSFLRHTPLVSITVPSGAQQSFALLKLRIAKASQCFEAARGAPSFQENPGSVETLSIFSGLSYRKAVPQ